MNGDMPHVPITTLAGIASLTDLLNQLPLPSPLPATTTKSLLFNGRIAEEVNCLLACRDENLVSQLAHSLNQVSTEHIELKDNLGSDDPEGDVPVLLQTVLSRNPNIFREKNLMQQPMMPQYKMSQNSMHGSPASTNYQQTTISHSPSSRFAPPQMGSDARFTPQQNSPVPSPYAPQSPAAYMQQYPHPPSYSQHQQIQQVASPMVPGGMRNIHDNKVSGQISSNSANHNARHGSNEDYMNIVHRLGNEESDPSMRNASFPLRSPQSVCSPAGSEGTPKAGLRPSLILHSPHPYASPRDGAPDLLLDSPDCKKKQKKLTKEEKEQLDKAAMYDIVSSPSKDSTKLTLKLSRVKSTEMDQSGELLPGAEDQDTDLAYNSLQLSRTQQDPAHRLGPGQGEQSGYQQVPVLQNTKQAGGVVSGAVYDDAEMDALAEIERIERETLIERERCSKEVQDKDKPLKKRKQDSYPQEPGAGGTAGATQPGVGGGNAGSKLAPQEASAASNGASRPALMVSIDLQQAGRADGQPEVNIGTHTPALRSWPEERLGPGDGSDSTGVLRLNSKTEGDTLQTADVRPEVIKQRANTPKKLGTDVRPETPKHKHENRRDSSKHRHEGKPDNSKARPDTRMPDKPRQRHEGRSDSGHREDRSRESDPSRIRRPETPSKSSRGEHDSKHGRDRDRERGDKDREKKHRTEAGDPRDRRSPEQRSRPESPRVKTDRPGPNLKSPNKEERRSGEERRTGDGSRNRQDSKQQPAENKQEFPAYLLGGVKSGGFKNFVIPKVKRDKDGHVLAAEMRKPGLGSVVEGWKEPRVKLERLGLVEKMKTAAKPVVVLQKLSIDEVQKIIRERKDRSARSSKSSKKSTMPLCERVKMNKRKRSTIKEKPKYAELSSDDDDDDDDNSVTESTRKRHKKERETTWEPHERRGSGRRGSGSRHRERSPEDSDDESPPPSMSDLLRKMKKKEKQKKRKAYEPKLTAEELMDSSTFKRFSASVDNILESLEDIDFNAMEDDEIPQELLLGKHQLSELASESAKIKAMGITFRLVKVLNILEKNIQDGSKLSTLMNHDADAEDEERLWRDLIMERVTRSADACLTALNIMTSARMPKAVYIEDVIERVLQYTKFHLQNTLYPQYDPVYRVDPHRGGLLSSRAKRAKSSTHKQRVIIMLYNKVCDIVSNISELLEIQLLTDTTILQVSSMGITPFFVESVSELQLCAIKLVTAVFSRYEKHRQLILEEIFTSLARLPTSKRSLRNFRLNSCDKDGEPMYIQMVTALVLQLIQCVVHLPNNRDSHDEYDKKVDQDVLITNSYETAMRAAQNFLSVFLKKCGSKQGEEDYRPLFENFVQDLLSTVNKPEWPAAELLLSLLGRLLVHQFSNKQTEMALRVASLDYLGTVAARLRKDGVTSKMDQRSIDRILSETQGNDETQQLQKALLDYMDENAETDPSLYYLSSFLGYLYFTIYIFDYFYFTTFLKKIIYFLLHTSTLTPQITEKGSIHTLINRSLVIPTASDLADSLNTHALFVNYVRVLDHILRVLGESAIAVRTKAMKCLSEVVAVDPSILARLDMQRGVHGRLMDNSTSVREAAVELLGRFVLSRPQLTEQYYDMLIERILDTGISVRKRVIKILRDICLEQPTFNKITEMCVKMIRRVNDEEGIKKLVNETFQKLWFTPTPNHDKDAMTRKILNITDVVSACKDTGYDWFEQLLQNLLKTEEDAAYKPARKACVHYLWCTRGFVFKLPFILTHECTNKGVNSNRLVSCITTLFLFSKIRSQLMVKHAMTIQPYLTTKCNTQSDFMVICNVAKILELVIPLMEHPSETFLTTIEEDLMKLIIKYGMTVVQHCVSCLGAVVNRVTRNYKFVWACFNRYYGALTKLKTQHSEDSNNPVLAANKPALLRSLFTVGALCRHFDFDEEEFKGPTKVVIKEKVMELLLYFTKHEDEEVQTKAIIGLGKAHLTLPQTMLLIFLFLPILHSPGFQFIQYPGLMFMQDVMSLYNGILSDRKSSVNLKIQVLKNLQTYLQEEDSRMQEADQQWKKLSKQEDLKEMGDISSGMSSSIMQLYLKQVLEAFFHTQSTVRHFALNVIALTLNQGLIHPVQCVPYLIAMGTDPEPTMRNKADQQLVEIDKKYSGFIHMKAVAGMKMSYQVQQAIWSAKGTVIRGYRQDETTSALCAHLFSMVRSNRQHRRAFLISLLNLFDDSSKMEVNMLLYMADNLACFPYQIQEEPLFIMHHIDITLSVSGSNLLQSFKEVVKDAKTKRENGKHKNSRPKIINLNSTSSSAHCSKIQKYSPTESAKVYEKAVNRKGHVHFSPHQTLDFLTSDLANVELTYDIKRRIVKQYLDFKLLMEHLDPDEEDEEGEASASANARNKAITSLLGGPIKECYVRCNTAVSPQSSRRLRKHGDSAEASGHMNETLGARDVIALCCPKYKERPQIARIIQKTNTGYRVQWMAGSYSGVWGEAKKRDGRKTVPWVDTIKESDIIYKKIALTSAHKLTNRVVQTLRSLYSAKEGTS
uniref:Nipped-B protein n=1 Tax=Hucho hucho TaxID=62062 RepID=A0A4W5LZC5_9TELE